MTASASGTVDQPGRNVRQKAGLNRSILDVGWAQFTSILTAKAESAGRRVVRVNPSYTSLTCHACGTRCGRPRQDTVVCPSTANWTPTSTGRGTSHPGPGWALVKPQRLERLPAPVGRAVTRPQRPRRRPRPPPAAVAELRGAAGWHWTWGAVALLAAPVNAAARLAVAAREQAGRGGTRDLVQGPVRPAVMTLRQVGREAAVLLPGCIIRRRLFWRYLLRFRS